MFSRVQAGARLLGRVSGTNVSRSCQQILCDLRGPGSAAQQQHQQWLAAPSARSSSSSTAARPLSGKNIFQLRAAVEAVETSADQQEQQQQPTQKQKQQQQQKQQKRPHTQQEAPEIVPLPTSDESEQLLRIRHSVSVLCHLGGGGIIIVSCVWGFWASSTHHTCAHVGTQAGHVG